MVIYHFHVPNRIKFTYRSYRASVNFFWFTLPNGKGHLSISAGAWYEASHYATHQKEGMERGKKKKNRLQFSLEIFILNPRIIWHIKESIVTMFIELIQHIIDLIWFKKNFIVEFIDACASFKKGQYISVVYGHAYHLSTMPCLNYLFLCPFNYPMQQCQWD